MSWIAVGATVAGAALGKVKNDKAKQIEDAERKLASETERYGYITGNKAQPVHRAGSTFGDIGQGALSGAMFGQQFGKGPPTAPEGQMSDAGSSVWEQLQEQERQKGMMGSAKQMIS